MNRPEWEVLEFFRGYAAPVTELVEATDEADIQRHDIYGGETLQQWGAGRGRSSATQRIP